jgi:hypothetical protein
MLSLLAVGGGGTVIPDMHRYLVESRHWMTDEQFAALYAISQASPGPNILFVALFGWQVAGAAGAFASMVGICGPSSVIALGSNTSRAARRTRCGRADPARPVGADHRPADVDGLGAGQQRRPQLDRRGGDAGDGGPDAEDEDPPLLLVGLVRGQGCWAV